VRRNAVVFVAQEVDRRGSRGVASKRPRDTPDDEKTEQQRALVLEIDGRAKEIVQELGAAINAAVERSPEVAEAIERLRAAGYEMELTLRLEIGLRELGEDGEEATDDTPFELTDEDRRTLRGMKIRIDDAD
jgi:hypothetical protein